MVHLLLVDASAISQKVIGKQLGGAYNLSVVGDIKDAKINLARTHFDALILSADDGFDEIFGWVYDLRRPDSPMVERPILFISSRYSDDLAYRAWRSGVNASFPKPLSGDAFRAELDRQIENPTSKPVPRSACSVELVSWVKGGIHYLYSPDLDRLVTAESEVAAQRQMQLIFEQFWYRFEQSRFGEARVRVRKTRFAFHEWAQDEHLAFDSRGLSGTSSSTLRAIDVAFIQADDDRQARPAVDPDQPPDE